MSEIEEKIKNELSAFQDFKRLRTFTAHEITHINDTSFCCGFPLTDEAGELIPECDQWINVGFKIKSSLSKALSNLFPYQFYFRGFELNSIESFFQGIKFPNADIQKYVFAYSGTEAYHIQSVSDYNWRATGTIYWQGKTFNRESAEYESLVDEVYISAIQNPLYRQVLKKANKYILHSIGKTDKKETVFTREEFEKELNMLSAFVKHF